MKIFQKKDLSLHNFCSDIRESFGSEHSVWVVARSHQCSALHTPLAGNSLGFSILPYNVDCPVRDGRLPPRDALRRQHAAVQVSPAAVSHNQDGVRSINWITRQTSIIYVETGGRC